jgi:anthranilate phosphoribosyltransferase
VSEVRGSQVREFTWTPADFGLPAATLESMLVDAPAASAAMIRGVLAGQPGPARDIVVLNAAAAIWTAGQAPSPQAAALSATAAIDSGAARDLLTRLATASGGA